jgi:Domain of unknown function (DUF4426)
MQTTIRKFSVVICAAALTLAACGREGQIRALPAQSAQETFQDFGNYEVHFNAVRTDSLTAEVARAYNIERSKNRVLLNVTVLHKEADHAPRKPVEGKVEVDAYNLNGQLKGLEMRRISEGDAIYYVGEVSISGTEILVFDIKVTPVNETSPLEVKFKREFFSD